MASNTRPAKSPVVVSQPNGPSATKAGKSRSYASEGVKDNDISKLGTSEWSILGALTLIGSFVRLFRIYQPTSVVFDEVQYVSQANAHSVAY